MDPEGDNKGLGNAGAIGSANDAPRADEVLALSPKDAGFAAMSMLDMRTEDRAGCLADLRLERLARREWTGRPCSVVVMDNVHRMLPARLGPRRHCAVQRLARVLWWSLFGLASC